MTCGFPTCQFYLCQKTSEFSERPENIVTETFAEPKRFKTRAAHFPILRDERTGMQRATLGKSDSEAAP